MKYEDALKVWGYNKLRSQLTPPESILMSDIDVHMVFVKGYNCGCGGGDPSCYCSMNEDPRADVEIWAKTTQGRNVYTSIDLGDFDFVGTLKEILEAANGSIEL